MLIWCAIFAALAAAGTWLARRYAVARALVDHPGERRSHSVPTPRGGGIAIVVALLLATFVLAMQEPRHAVVAMAFASGLSAVALAGLIDDHRPLSPWVRLAVHVVASAVLAFALMANGTDWKTALAAFVACVSLTNVWNFMDGINGLAATQAALIAFAVALVAGDAWILAASALAAACMGFLPFNFPHARIFLGDVGSGALGYSIAALAFVAGDGTFQAVTLVTLAVSAFLIDAGLTLLRRVLHGERWWTPHTRHAYQVCARRWGHARVTISYGAWTAISILIVRGVEGAPMHLTLAVMAAWYMSGALLWLWLQHRHGERPRTGKAGTAG